MGVRKKEIITQVNRVFLYDEESGKSIPLRTEDEFLGNIDMNLPADIRQQAIDNFYADEPDDGLGRSFVDEED